MFPPKKIEMVFNCVLAALLFLIITCITEQGRSISGADGEVGTCRGYHATESETTDAV